MDEDKFQSEKNRKRSIQDKLISGVNSLLFSITEPLKLKIARSRFEHLYENPTENPLVSIYTPTYNRGEILMERALPSVLNQTYKNFEYIILGDHCTDKTEELISKINDSRIKFYNLPERRYRYPESAENHWLAGPVVPANEALKLIRGKWIARLDDDEVWISDHIETSLLFAQKENYEFVSAQNVEERYGKKAIVDGIKARDPYFTDRPAKRDKIDDSPKIGGTSTWLYRSYLRFFKYNINCWRKKWNRVNDIELVLRMFNAGVRMGFINKVMLYALPRPGENTVGKDAYKLYEKEKLNHYKFKE